MTAIPRARPRSYAVCPVAAAAPAFGGGRAGAEEALRRGEELTPEEAVAEGCE
ncbi:hypothetical protein OG946_22060 [Streptomyces sp. NBC_01808]|uniref:hypothetical protein n=1 Tax=Streptomyces sp. NBC_01808 TaxID=2975947 RepID=UPI002DDA8D32|nr:hypothetical protein [Streptomyces sp. NBC_01808]WSA39814.1 hypothetical protein OG946_22060 [Streptomyces sp. NBC_01808]